MTTQPSMTRTFEVMILMIAGLWGLAGVMLLAAGAHADPRLSTAGSFLLFHAAAVIGLLSTQILGPKFKLTVLLLLVAGAGIFAADIVTRVSRGAPMIAMLAPVGGTFSMVGWLGILVGAGLKLYSKSDAA